MSLVVSGDLLRPARANHYVIGGINVDNAEGVEVTVAAAEEMESPVILQVGQLALQYTNLNLLAQMVLTAAEASPVPVALQLDHGTTYEQVIQCLRAGFSSIMFDGSHMPLEENIRATREVVRTAHAIGVSVEGEVGRMPRIGHHDDHSAVLTDPVEVERFVEGTGVDAVAISIGNVHGFYKGEAKLDLARLKKIGDRVPIPLVLHGGTGISPDEIKQSVPFGIAKVNVATELRRRFLESLAKDLCDGGHHDWYEVMKEAKEAMKQAVKERLAVFDSVNRASDYRENIPRRF